MTSFLLAAFFAGVSVGMIVCFFMHTIIDRQHRNK